MREGPRVPILIVAEGTERLERESPVDEGGNGREAIEETTEESSRQTRLRSDGGNGPSQRSPPKTRPNQWGRGRGADGADHRCLRDAPVEGALALQAQAPPWPVSGVDVLIALAGLAGGLVGGGVVAVWHSASRLERSG